MGVTAVRYKTEYRRSPQQAVDAIGYRVVRCVDHHLLALAVCFGCHAPGDIEWIVCEGVENNLGHLIVRFNRKCTSRDTGRPVEPLVRPPFHAVPAMSR